MIDTHCHLDGPAFAGDRDAVLARACAAGVTDVVVPGVAPEGWLGIVGLAAAAPGVHAALGIHRIRPTPVARDGQVVVRDVMHVSLTSDHRVVDGSEAAAFTYEVIRHLEDPSLLFLHSV